MVALEVRLDFTCCHCASPVGVTLWCEGRGLADNPLTMIALACPTCAQANQVHFTPEDGRLHRVTRDRVFAGVPAPSHN